MIQTSCYISLQVLGEIAYCSTDDVDLAVAAAKVK